MPKISRRLSDLNALPQALEAVGEQLRYHTESGFTLEEANAYAGQLGEIQKILVPLWRQRLEGRAYGLQLDCDPSLGGFLRIRALPEGGAPVEVFTESYVRFNAEMCDGSCHQYVYQKVLCYEDGLASGRVPL
jgi:hypothetical protein